jgi:flagellar hook-associated protein 3 FlgL
VVTTRVTERGSYAAALDNLQGALGKLQGLQDQIASGKQISKPSDSPDGIVSALRYRADLRRIEQYKRNSQDGLDWLGVADTTLQKGLTVLNRAQELAVQGRNGSLDANARDAIAKEVDSLRETMLSLANTTVGNRPLFAGTADVPAAYDANGVYQGVLPGTAGDRVERAVGDDATVRVNLTGPEAFGTPGADVFQVLTDLAANLRTNPNAVAANLDQIQAAQTQLRSATATVGARYNQIQSLADRNESVRLDTTQSLSQVEDVDYAEATLNVKLQEVAYQAALSATAKVTRSSLLDFLR